MSHGRVLHITTLLQGGAGRIVADLACRQRAAGYDPIVACAAEGSDDHVHYPEWLDQLRAAGVPTVRVACTFRRSLHHLMGAVTDIERAREWGSGVDVVHAHAAVPALVGLLLGGRPRVLATMHGWNAHKAPDHAATDVAVFNRVTTVVVPSRAAATHLVDAGVAPERLTIVPYGVAPPQPRDLSPEDTALLGRWRDEGRLVVVCVGSVGERKRQALLLEALSAPGVRHRVACAFVGEGPGLDALNLRARELGMDASVAFLGYRAHAADWIRAASLAVFPSQREGLPVALLEATTLGTPVLASDIEEHREAITPGQTGLLFDAGNSQALAAALERAWWMSAAARQALADAARVAWRARYSTDHMHAEYDRLYRLHVAAPDAPALVGTSSR